MRYGEQARCEVHIFEDAPEALVGSVQEQRDYAERWVSFFRGRLNSSG